MFDALSSAPRKKTSRMVLVMRTMRNSTRQPETFGGTEARSHSNPRHGAGILHFGFVLRGFKDPAVSVVM